MTPEFRTVKDRDDWIIDHADYFTIVRHRDLHYDRFTTSNLTKARIIAKVLRQREPTGKPWMIYAVAGVSDTLVEVIQ